MHIARSGFDAQASPTQQSQLADRKAASRLAGFQETYLCIEQIDKAAFAQRLVDGQSPEIAKMILENTGANVRNPEGSQCQLMAHISR